MKSKLKVFNLAQLLTKAAAWLKRRTDPGCFERIVGCFEFSSSSLKYVKMAAQGKKLRVLKTVSTPTKSDSDEGFGLELVWREALGEIAKSENLGEQELLLSVNHPQATFARFVVPKVPEKELLDILKWKMGDLLPFPAAEASFHYRLFQIPGTEKEPRYHALVTAVPEGTVNRMLAVFRDLNSPKPLTVHSLFHGSIFSIPSVGSESPLTAVVDLGQQITEINMYQHGQLVFVRKVPFGSRTILEALKQSLSLSSGPVALTEEEAERALREEDFFDHDAERLFAGKIQVSKLFALLRPEFEKLAGELQRSFDYYIQEHGEGLARVLLTGGLSRLRGLTEFLQVNLNVPVKPLTIQDDLTFDASVSPEAAVDFYRPIGLAANRMEQPVSLLSELEKSANHTLKRLPYRPIAAALLSSFIALILALGAHAYTIEKKTEAISRQISNLRPGFEFAEKVRALETQVQMAGMLLIKMTEDAPLYDEFFRELSQALPPNVTLSGLSYANNQAVLQGVVEEAGSDTAISNLLLTLGGPLLKNVTLVSLERNEAEQKSSVTIKAEVAP